MPNNQKIIYVGDPHGESTFIRDMATDKPFSIFVILGDLQFTEEQLLSFPSNVFWIHGNHDTDKDEYTHAINHPRNISSKIIDKHSIKIGGLGGIFRQKSWDVRNETYNFFSRQDKINSLFKNQTMPRKEASSIYPNDVEKLIACGTSDILVTHEAPYISRLKGGFRKIDEVAKQLKAKTIIHGHHHISYKRKEKGTTVFGVGLREMLCYDVAKKTYTFLNKT